MFNELIAVFKNNSLMQRTYELSYEMINRTHAMFLQAHGINKYQKEVRRDIYE